ncbi:ornithine cyclodeaminase family protein [Fodinicurvata sp. EGI_FJ10296]|uniref:ornithine cyclodeaminase family protein n=1 Tax=Fodinicurvata sp. EGI_FJ10296 TaxID=3231908 RepID=UPI003455A411
MQLRILSEQDVRSVITMTEAIDVQAEAFVALSQDKSIEGLRSFALSETPPGIAIFNPSFLKNGGGYGIKVVSDFYDNEKKKLPRMSSLVALFDGETGAPRTVMEGGYLTDLRTGAGTALAARYLARKDSRTVAIIGAGRVARNQLEAICAEFSIERVLVSTRSQWRGEAYIDRMKKTGNGVPTDIVLVDSPADAVREADIVVAATTAHDPVFSGDDLRLGTFVAAAGAYEASMREVDSRTIARSTKWVVDSRADCLDHAGDLVAPMKEGIITADQVSEIADLVSGRRSGRENDDEITYFKSIGVPIQDLMTAQHIERRALERSIGTMIEFGGDDG